MGKKPKVYPDLPQCAECYRNKYYLATVNRNSKRQLDNRVAYNEYHRNWYKTHKNKMTTLNAI